LNGGSYTPTAAEREEKVIKQLSSLYGPEAEKYVAYHEKYGAKKYLLLPYEELVMAHQNNGHPDYKTIYKQ
jgi:monoamine oxidase